MNIHFWGATDEVTGSMTFLELPDGFVMIDCGLTQGPPEVEKINLMPLPFAISEIKAVIITHAHLDHSGYLPRLVKKGFRGTIYCTPATAKLMRIILLDSAKLNEDGFYEVEDVEQTLHQVKTHEWDEKFDILGAWASFFPAGHILGASSVLIKSQGKRIVFSGDLGRNDDPILPPLGPCPKADVVIMESTYGGKVRSGNLEQELHSFLVKVARESRVAIIASFAVARGQTLLTLIHDFYERHPEEKVRVVMDSPMMKEANKVYQQYAHLTKFKQDLYAALDDVDSIDFQKEWTSLSHKSGPLIILSSSGMLTGGRIARHLYNWREDKRAILFLPGYQGIGTPGRSMQEGKRQLLSPSGEIFEWSGEVLSSEAFSSHADQNGLINWVETNNQDAKVFLLHGEPTSKIALQKKIKETVLNQVELPSRGSSFAL
jgi:metallo-beta-lactamase family protein